MEEMKARSAELIKMLERDCRALLFQDEGTHSHRVIETRIDDQRLELSQLEFEIMMQEEIDDDLEGKSNKRLMDLQ